MEWPEWHDTITATKYSRNCWPIVDSLFIFFAVAISRHASSIWKPFVSYIFNFFSLVTMCLDMVFFRLIFRPVFLSSISAILIMWTLVHLMLFQRSVKLSSFVFICLSFICSALVIFHYSSSSMIHTLLWYYLICSQGKHLEQYNT